VTTDRTRTHSWSDPRIALAAFGRTTGLEVARAVVSGEIPPPPIGSTIGYRITEADPGRVVFEIEPGEHLTNPMGSMHGGVYAVMLDSAAGGAVQTLLEVGEGLASMDLSVKFLDRITADSGTLWCEGTVVHRSRRTALAEARLFGKDDRLYGHATSTVMILPAR
jgi:uncharacterized protein (TIGR00369 family)